MITARGLTKDFAVARSQTVHAVRGIDLDVARGEVVAVLGPNGAGKTTTMRMLTTLLAPTAGTATVAGHDVTAAPDRVRRVLGYVGQGNGAAHTQRAVDELAAQGQIYGMTPAAARARAGELLDSLDLSGKARSTVTQMSGGQRRRLDVAMGLVHAPQLLVLDEPSTGLDPHNRANLWEHISALREQHEMTLLLTTHYLDEADQMAARVVIVDHGRIIADDTPQALKSRYAADRLAVSTGSTHGAAVLAEHVRRWKGSQQVQTEGGRVLASITDGAQRVADLVRAADAAEVSITDVTVTRPTLDDVFLTLTGRSLREAETTATTDPTEEKAA